MTGLEARFQLERLSTDQPYYTDRAYRFTSLPTALEGACQIKTPNDDKQSDDAMYLSFTVTNPARVYLAYDERTTALPSSPNLGPEMARLPTTDGGRQLIVRPFVCPGDCSGPWRLPGNGLIEGARSAYVVLVRGE